MKIIPGSIRLAIISFLGFTLVGGFSAHGNVVGYVNYTNQPGGNLIGNPLANTNHFLSTILAMPPDQTSVSLWDPVANQYSLTAVFQMGAWSVDLELAPGQGALLSAPSSFVNLYVGEVLNPDGSPFNGIDIVRPPPFAGPDGLYLFSSRFPAVLGPGTYSVFDFIVGRAPREGEQFTTLDPLSQTFLTTTFAAGVWDNGEPGLPIGQAAFFNLVPVPEPTALALLALGAVLLTAVKRRPASSRRYPAQQR